MKGWEKVLLIAGIIVFWGVFFAQVGKCAWCPSVPNCSPGDCPGDCECRGGDCVSVYLD